MAIENQTRQFKAEAAMTIEIDGRHGTKAQDPAISTTEIQIEPHHLLKQTKTINPIHKEALLLIQLLIGLLILMKTVPIRIRNIITHTVGIIALGIHLAIQVKDPEEINN